MSEQQTAILAVRGIFDGVIAEGLKLESVAAATDAEIDDWAAAQGVSFVPVAVREVLRSIGLRPGLWLSGSSFGVKRLGPQAKAHAVATLSRLADPLEDSSGMLVLVEHEAYSYHVIDGAELQHPNPPVWLIDEAEGAQKLWPSVTNWFGGISPRIKDYRTRIALLRAHGAEFIPAWADHIRAE